MSIQGDKYNTKSCMKNVDTGGNGNQVFSTTHMFSLTN